MRLQLDRRFKKKLQGMFGRYDFEVGILEDKPHRVPLRGARGLQGKDVLGLYAGGPIRKASRKRSSQTVSEVSAENRKRLGFNYLSRPFDKRSKSNDDILRFTKEFFKIVFGKSEKRRAENLLQAIVRNPMLRGEYGAPNSDLTQKIKGFNRPMIDTAQLFKAIKAKCTVKGRR